MPRDDASTADHFYEGVYETQAAYATSADDQTTFESRVKEMAPFLTLAGLTLEIGCGRGLMRSITERYVGTDISFSAMRGQDFVRLAASATNLPFPDAAFTDIFSYHTLEHIVAPEMTLLEMHRLVKPGGTIFLKPAWNCRPWNNKKLKRKPYHLLSLRDRITKCLLPIIDSVVWRGLNTIPKRLAREFLYSTLQRPTTLKYTRLTPNHVMDDHWVADADAAAAIDPHEVIWFYKSRGYDTVSHNTFWARVFARSEGVGVRHR